MSKVVEKIVTTQLSQYYKKYSKLYPEKIEGQKERLTIDIIAILVHIVKER